MQKSILRYKNLIQSLPVKEQSFEIKAYNWKIQLNDDDFENLFRGESSIYLNRQDVHDTNPTRIFLLKVILWGYPKGKRGHNFAKIYEKIDNLCELLNVPHRKTLSMQDLQYLQSHLMQVNGLGLSTYTKFLYFRDFTFDGYPALILDERLMRVFKDRIFEEFSSISGINNFNKHKMYSDYLSLMGNLAKELETQPENIEQFLFLFGNHLK